MTEEKKGKKEEKEGGFVGGLIKKPFEMAEGVIEGVGKIFGGKEEKKEEKEEKEKEKEEKKEEKEE